MSQAGTKYGVLFDVDGTLVDSNYLHTLAWWYAFRQQNHLVPMASIHRSIGMGSDKLISHLLGADVDDAGKLSASHDAVFSTYWPFLYAFDDAGNLLKRCAEEGLGVVLASSAKRRELGILRDAIDAGSAVTAATSSSDAKESKPSPDILSAALEAGGLSAENVVFVGDAVWDVEAAGKLGIPTIGLGCGGTSEAELREAGAVETYSSPAALLESFSTSRIGQLLSHG